MADPAAPGHPPVPWEHLMARLGGLIHLSAQIERDLSRGIERLSGQAPPAKTLAGEKLRQWRVLQAGACAHRPDHAALLDEVSARLARVQALRNGLIHGLAGARADPSGHHGDAGYHIDLEDGPDFLPFAHLDGILPVMNHLIWSIQIMTDASLMPDPARAEKALAGIRLNHLPPMPAGSEGQAPPSTPKS